ncbi:BACON domain-containing protein [Alistipes sp.]|nr:BACON domain-containing protein [uncultured Alistipes sp.]
MRKLFYLIACLSLTGLLGACNDDKENGDDGELSFKFPLTEYESAKIGGKKVIGFSTVGDWTAEVKYKVAPATVDDEWLEISPKSGNAGHWFLTLNLDENTDYDDREAEVVITSGGETKTLKVTQFSTSAMFLPQTTYNVGESGGPVALTVQTNRPFSVEADDACKDWIIVPDSKAVMKDSVFNVTVLSNPALDARTGYVYVTEIVADEKEETLTRRIEIVQRGDFGYFIMRGSSSDLTAPSVVQTGENAFNAFYLFKQYSANREEMHVWNGDAQGPIDLSANGEFGVRFVAAGPFTDMQVSCCTWSQQHGDGVMTASLYVWDTDYATTVKRNPVNQKKDLSYGDNSWPSLLNADQGNTYPAGEYLVVMQSTKQSSGVWSASAGAKDGFQGFLAGQAVSSNCPKVRIYYVSGSKTGAAYRETKDGGVTWRDQSYVFSLNESWLEKCSPTDLRVVKCDGYYYAAFADGGNVKLARTANIKDSWAKWDGSAWGDGDYASVVASEVPVSVVENNGQIYLYTMKGNKLVVRTAASGDNWPAALSASADAWTFDSNTDVDVKFVNGKFTATYVKSNQTCVLLSDDGTTFTDGGVAYARMFDGSKSARYASGVTGETQYMSYACTQGWYFKIISND